jgi:hypothetical protein
MFDMFDMFDMFNGRNRFQQKFYLLEKIEKDRERDRYKGL